MYMKEIKVKSQEMLRVQDDFGIQLEEFLRQLFVVESLHTRDIEHLLGISHVTLLKWLKLAGIYSRKIML